MAQTRGTQTLPGKQAVRHQGPVQAVQALKQQSGFFKSTFFAGDIHAHKNMGGRQDGGESIHDERLIMHPLGPY
jgi:hypothetical protein